jgi:hypothetical protein
VPLNPAYKAGLARRASAGAAGGARFGQKEDLFEMEKKKAMLAAGFLVSLTVAFLFIDTANAAAGVYYGRVVGIEGPIFQVKAENGGVSVFWCGYKTLLGSRLPFIGDKVKVEYVKDSLWRNAATRIAVLE